MNPHANPRELRHAKKADNQRIRHADCGRKRKKTINDALDAKHRGW
jgi:hypothetical protein